MSCNDDGCCQPWAWPVDLNTLFFYDWIRAVDLKMSEWFSIPPSHFSEYQQLGFYWLCSWHFRFSISAEGWGFLSAQLRANSENATCRDVSWGLIRVPSSRWRGRIPGERIVPAPCGRSVWSEPWTKRSATTSQSSSACWRSLLSWWSVLSHRSKMSAPAACQHLFDLPLCVCICVFLSCVTWRFPPRVCAANSTMGNLLQSAAAEPNWERRRAHHVGPTRGTDDPHGGHAEIPLQKEKVNFYSFTTFLCQTCCTVKRRHVTWFRRVWCLLGLGRFGCD